MFFNYLVTTLIVKINLTGISPEKYLVSLSATSELAEIIEPK
jgi:hypothetical protein